jgi:hypothetical protein
LQYPTNKFGYPHNCLAACKIFRRWDPGDYSQCLSSNTTLEDWKSDVNVIIGIPFVQPPVVISSLWFCFSDLLRVSGVSFAGTRPLFHTNENKDTQIWIKLFLDKGIVQYPGLYITV